MTFNKAEGNAGDGFHFEGLEVIALDFPLVINAGEVVGSFDSEANVVVGNTAILNAGYGFQSVDAAFASIFRFNRSKDNGLGEVSF